MSKNKEKGYGLSGKAVVFIVLIVMILSFSCGLLVSNLFRRVEVETGLITQQLFEK